MQKPAKQSLSPGHPHLRHWYGCRESRSTAALGTGLRGVADLVSTGESVRMDPGWEIWVSGQGVNCWFSRGAATAEESHGLEITGRVPKTVLDIPCFCIMVTKKHNHREHCFKKTVSELKNFWELHHCSFDSGVPPPFVMALRLTTDLQSITRHSHTVWRVSRSYYTHGILAGVRYKQPRFC